MTPIRKPTAPELAVQAWREWQDLDDSSSSEPAATDAQGHQGSASEQLGAQALSEKPLEVPLERR
jgi:hypothetical protein